MYVFALVIFILNKTGEVKRFWKTINVCIWWKIHNSFFSSSLQSCMEWLKSYTVVKWSKYWLYSLEWKCWNSLQNKNSLRSKIYARKLWVLTHWICLIFLPERQYSFGVFVCILIAITVNWNSAIFIYIEAKIVNRYEVTCGWTDFFFHSSWKLCFCHQWWICPISFFLVYCFAQWNPSLCCATDCSSGKWFSHLFLNTCSHIR